MENVNNVSVLSKRISAYLIDILFVFLVVGLVSGIKFINPYYDKYNEAYENYNELLQDYTDEKITDEEFNELYSENYYLVSKYSVSYNIVIIVSIVLYFGVFQKYNKGQTLGKKIMKVKVVSNSGEENVSLGKYLLRLLPIYYIYIGGLIPLIINSILCFILTKNSFMTVTMIVSYIFLFVSIVSFIMICIRKDKRGLQDFISNTKVVYIGK